MPAIVRIGDKSAGHCFEPRPNLEGSPNVFVNGKAVARMGDQQSCGDICAEGSPNVFVN